MPQTDNPRLIGIRWIDDQLYLLLTDDDTIESEFDQMRGMADED